jgi:ribose transport system ATP-binding protein
MTATAPTQTTLLSLDGVWKRFPGVVALRDVSFSVRAGEVHALLGENGAGKSTLMGIAGGEIAPDEGTISFGDETIDKLVPEMAHERGLAIVHQHPALLPDLTVAENMALAVRRQYLADRDDDWMREELDRVGCHVKLETRVEDLGVANRALIELAKALALRPRILILDEPTAALGADMVERVFEAVREAAARDAAVVYISHRLPEIRQIADRVTVMRDGAMQATDDLDALTDEDILRLIVGRSVSSTFPPKGTPANGGRPLLQVSGLSGAEFKDVDLTVSGGEIVGLAGIDGNGQSEFLRALAGLEGATGTVELAGRPLKLGRPDAARAARVAYLPADRHGEGLLMSLTVRENASFAALPRFARHGVVDRGAEVAAVEGQREALSIRTSSIERDVATLSGGNQQKVVLARALLGEPSVVLAEEPTQGVDAGAHIEIYRILRQVADSGIPVVVLSSDGVELEGLCDRVVVFSRGQVVGELAGEDVTEEKIGRTIVTATAHRRQEERPVRHRLERAQLFAKGDYAPSLILGVVMVLLAIYTWNTNGRFLATFNLTSMMTLLAALAFIAFGQLIVIMTAGIDLSVGPLAGLLVVISSFFVLDHKSPGTIVLGFALMLAVAIAVGLINASFVQFAKFPPVAATLATYIGLQGISLLLRHQQGGFIRQDVTDRINSTVANVPWAFIFAVALAVVLELALRRSRWGLSVRAVGSREQAAHRVGVRTGREIVLAYVACSVLTFLGALMLMAQLGVGDPTQGTTFTLSSITAVVLGGASLFGGRGSFVGALLGAALITEITSATTFLNLSQAWQFWFLGILTLVAASIYTTARRGGLKSA